MVLKKSLFITASFLSLFSITILANNNSDSDSVKPKKKNILAALVQKTESFIINHNQNPVVRSTSSIPRETIFTPKDRPQETASMFGQWNDTLARRNNPNTPENYSFFGLLNSALKNTEIYPIYAGFTAWFKKNLFW